MADHGQRTEKPTKRKLEKARREGQFPASRELLAALQFLTFVALLGAFGDASLDRDAGTGTLLSRRRLPLAPHAARCDRAISTIARTLVSAAARMGAA